MRNKYTINYEQWFINIVVFQKMILKDKNTTGTVFMFKPPFLPATIPAAAACNAAADQ